MKYRAMGRLGWKVSALGFGAMRLPTKKQDGKDVIDEDQAIKIIRYAIRHGVNYVDTAWPYHSEQSEIVVGKALQKGYRRKVKLVTKLPLWAVNTPDDFDIYLSKQLAKLQTPYLDIYLFHSVDHDRFEKIKRLNLVQKMENAKKNGLIRHFGFSFHDSLDVFREIIDHYPWEVAQIQFNYVDNNEQATIEGLRYAAAKGVAMVIMEPVKGGNLVNPPSEVRELFQTVHKKRTPVDWALQYVWDQPEVSVALSGMGSLQMVKENIASANRSGIHQLTKPELDILALAGRRIKKKSLIPCTFCKYCLPCPSGVYIPQNFHILNDFFWDNDEKASHAQYSKLVADANGLIANPGMGNAALCIKCKQCLSLCPQSINIPGELVKVHQIMGEGKTFDQVFCLTVRGPKYVSKPEFLVIGLLNPGTTPESIPALWDQLFPRQKEISNIIPGISLGISKIDPNTGKDQYLAGYPVQSITAVPSGMVVEKIPAHDYAMFTLLGSLKKFSSSLDYICSHWEGYSPHYRPDPPRFLIEYYDQRFSPDSDNSEIDLFIPIKKTTK